jgi:hypothetical protein
MGALVRVDEPLNGPHSYEHSATRGTSGHLMYWRMGMTGELDLSMGLSRRRAAHRASDEQVPCTYPVAGLTLVRVLFKTNCGPGVRHFPSSAPCGLSGLDAA